MEITISGKDKKLLRQVEELAIRLGLSISKTEKVQENKKEKVLEALENLSRINAFADIDDPVAWQREQRKDRVIDGGQ